VIVFEGIVAAIVGVALLAALLQFTGFAPTGARASQTIGQPTVVEPIYVQWSTIAGEITFVRKAGGQQADKVIPQDPAFSYSKDGLKINCQKLTISAFDGSGTAVATAMAVKGADPGTCSYSLRVPAATALTLTVTDGGKGAIWAYQVGGSSGGGDKDLKNMISAWSLAPQDKWQTADGSLKTQIKSKDPSSSQTVPLSISIGV
jgi:hypothetical protein